MPGGGGERGAGEVAAAVERREWRGRSAADPPPVVERGHRGGQWWGEAELLWSAGLFISQSVHRQNHNSPAESCITTRLKRPDKAAAVP